MYLHEVHIMLDMIQPSFDNMIRMSKQIRNIERTLSLLAWDERTYMPEGALQGRSRMNAALAKIRHQILTSQSMKECIDVLNKPSVHDELDELQRASVREMTRYYEKRNSIPNELVENIAKSASEGQAIWTKARAKSDFKMFIPCLKQNLELKKEAAECMGYENEPYDALLDEYEPGLNAKGVKGVFDPMKKDLAKLVGRIVNTKSAHTSVYDGIIFDTAIQKKLCKKIAEDIGFDFNRGRLDDTVHPFTVGMDYDVRITNRYNENDLSAIYSLLHEVGHGIYEQGLNSNLYGTPIGRVTSMGYHESQSRLWENFVGRNRSFMDYLYPLLVDFFPDFKKVEIEDFFLTVNRVEPSFIRVEADEITYNLHIALRFDIELGMMRGDIDPAETETVWNDKMEEYLGLRPEDPAQGVLQDIHWSYGAFGYFPSYALGNLYAAQIYNTVKDRIPSLNQKISIGEFKPLHNWLKHNIHERCRIYRPKELTEKLTGESLNYKHFSRYVKVKYKEIHGL